MKSFETIEDECIICESNNSNILRQNLNIDQMYKILHIIKLKLIMRNMYLSLIILFVYDLFICLRSIVKDHTTPLK